MRLMNLGPGLPNQTFNVDGLYIAAVFTVLVLFIISGTLY